MKVRYLSQPTLSSIKVGQTIYYAHALGPQSFVYEGIVLREPYEGTLKGFHFIDVQTTCKYGTFTNNWSTRDMGIEVNDYNQHKAFYHKADAEKYVEQCKRDNTGARFNFNTFYGW